MSLDIIKKLNSILDKRQKLVIFGLMFLILIGGLLETFSVSLVMPLISAILDEKAFAGNAYVLQAQTLLGIDNVRTLIVLMLMALMAMFVLKNAYLVWLTYIQSRFVNKNRCKCTTNLLNQYLNKPYEYYLYAETSDILRTIYGDMDNIFNLLLQCMNLAAELVVSVCLGIFLLCIDFKMMVFVVGLLLAVTLFVSKVIKPRLNNVGENAREAQASLYKWILQGVTGIKDVKVYSKEKYFVKNYYQYANEYANYQVSNNVLTNLPRLLIETIAIVGILAYMLINMLIGADITNMVPLMSAFALAAMRLLPSVNRVNTYMANIAYYEPALNFIHENVNTEGLGKEDNIKQLFKENTDKRMALHREVRLTDITFAYPKSEKKIFHNADMVIPAGHSVGVIGQSGAGKTTVIDILLGLLQLQSGTISCDGQDIFTNYSGWLSNIGYIPQTITMLDDTIRRNIAFGVRDEDIDDDRIWEVLKEAQMKEFVEELPDNLDTSIGERGVRISGGQRQRLGIARALYHDPELLVFDEATSALDNDTEAAIMEAIDSLHGQKTMVIIAHRLKTIENCDIIYEVRDGKIDEKCIKPPFEMGVHNFDK